MITPNDIGKYFYDMFREYGVEERLAKNMPYKPIDDELIVVITSEEHYGKYWFECVVKVNWCVPDIEGEEHSPRTDEVQEIMKQHFQGCGELKNRYFTYRMATFGTVTDADMRCHYVNLTLTFKIQNIL